MADSEPAQFSASVGRAVHEYTWLVVDAFLLLFLLTGLLAYKEFDDAMRIFFRTAFVAFWWYAWLSGLHLLVFLRHSDRGEMMPAYASYPIYLCKAAVMVAFVWWCTRLGVLKW